MMNIPPNWNLIKMTLSTRNILALNGLLAMWLNFRLKPLEEVSPNLPDDDRYIAGGFVEKTPAGSSLSHDKLQPYHAIIHPVQLQYLHKIIETLKEKGIETVLVTAPVSDRYLASITNYEDWKQSIVESALNYNVPFIDFNEYKHLTASELFYDIDHLNSGGVKKFNEELYKHLLLLPGFQKMMKESANEHFLSKNVEYHYEQHSLFN
jgi:hypothetical protein